MASTHIQLDAALDSGGRGLGAAVGHGTDALFAIASGGAYDVDGTGHLTMIAGTIGTDQPLSPDNKFRVCPMVTVGYAAAANGVLDDAGRGGVSVAGDVAMMAVNTARLWIVPTIGLDLRYNGVGRPAGFFAQHDSRGSGTFTAGIGFVIRNRLSLVPRVVVPFGSVDRAAFQVTASYNLPRR